MQIAKHHFCPTIRQVGFTPTWGAYSSLLYYFTKEEFQWPIHNGRRCYRDCVGDVFILIDSCNTGIRMSLTAKGFRPLGKDAPVFKLFITHIAGIEIIILFLTEKAITECKPLAKASRELWKFLIGFEYLWKFVDDRIITSLTEKADKRILTLGYGTTRRSCTLTIALFREC